MLKSWWTRLLVVAALALTSTAAGAGPAAAVEGTLNVLTWNIQGSHLPDSNITNTNAGIPTVVRHIQQSGAEYVGLQEVSAEDARKIADGLGWGTDSAHLRTAFEHDGPLPFGAGFYAEGIAMLSKYPMQSEVYEILPEDLNLHPDGRGRKLQHATIDKNGVIFHAFNTHLASNDWTCKATCAYVPFSNNDENRNRQARWVRDKVREITTAPGSGSATFFLGGDMNSHPVPDEANSAAYRTLRDAFTDSWLHMHPAANEPRIAGQPACTDDDGCTVSIRDGEKRTVTPTVRIDYFFVDTAAASRIRSVTTPSLARTVEFAPLSDHYPYQMTLG